MAVLDTNFLVALDAGDGAAVDLLAQMHKDGEVPRVPSLVAVEYAHHFPDPAMVIETICRTLEYEDTSTAWAFHATRLRQRLHQEVARIRHADFWIAAFADLHREAVITKDGRHFEAMGIPTRAW